MSQILEGNIFKITNLGLNHMHLLKIVHRDIKFDNIMVSSFNPLQIKIIDYGLCVIDQTS